MAARERTYGGSTLSARRTQTGKVFSVQGGSIQELQGWRVAGGISNDGPWTVENIAELTADWS